ncbi:Dihydrolipoamide acetyltransferase component of pyruvate dehydrogenase complex [Venustampulla echinocandica]|uniref:Dihydrolipoamide acetyltransferase component of pyruvate dehydrogenase complex n=1 Tax=Venustampulla echinocandica TaxID=2656787 RepID=A0A370U2G5_9HELO|nr:Dihydrolipoamide acetyltransferase component of pyruvate dehydrogenase complex [Venustampulla echinocandica]RDL41974.1 Dihydrolipoamide acetyltransferase component of pyruvate dehydrogenase complex [Venustampulla echinocandica]
MSLQSLTRSFLQQKCIYRGIKVSRHSRGPTARAFHSSRRLEIVKPFLLADIGEGIRECEIIQWFVEPEARVEEWDKLCEVQSDKASVEITSRFAGVIKKLHYDAGDMAKVGKPLLDIDIESNGEDVAALTGPSAAEESQLQEREVTERSSAAPIASVYVPPVSQSTSSTDQKTPVMSRAQAPQKPVLSTGKHATLATPAVRHLTKELNVNIAEVRGTGKDGRVTKDDVNQFAKQRDDPRLALKESSLSALMSTTEPTETTVPLTNIQTQMFKAMTKSLSKPHFLYADEIDFSRLSELRSRLNKGLAKAPIDEVNKMSFLPFIIKAMSLSMRAYPILNARVDMDPVTGKPALVHRSQHNIGVAMDTPSGLIVPVIKNAASLSILNIAAELTRLQSLAASGNLSTQDLTGGTITLSNIGNIGGTYVSPVIVEKEVAILGVGKMRTIPAFGDAGQVVAKQVCNFSWSADHRVVDGATMARAAEIVRQFVEDPDSMVMHLR